MMLYQSGVRLAEVARIIVVLGSGSLKRQDLPRQLDNRVSLYQVTAPAISAKRRLVAS